MADAARARRPLVREPDLAHRGALGSVGPGLAGRGVGRESIALELGVLRAGHAKGRFVDLAREPVRSAPRDRVRGGPSPAPARPSDRDQPEDRALRIAPWPRRYVHPLTTNLRSR